MWPGQQQSPEGGQYPQSSQHARPGPYGPPAGAGRPWNMPTQPAGTPAVVRERRSTTTVVAVVVAAAVVAAAAVTGFVVLGGDGDDNAQPPAPTTSPTGPATDDARADAGEQPTVPGWRTVKNPKTGIVFDVPSEWALKPVSWASYVAEESDPEETPLVGFSAPAMLKEKWCVSDENLDGSFEESQLGAAGSRTERGARTPEEAARDNAALWVYGGYTQPDKAKVHKVAAEAYTTASGIEGSVASAFSKGVEPKGRCDTDGKATTFAFKGPDGDILSWTFVGAKGVQEEVADATVRKILRTVRLTGD
ncbi:hypothetical protein ABZ070_20220 [Streptomyces sp. NPDC006283]|uniref:hypothetical protein n=1 Tax=Streptomyces sp. NPDC006283 TaxID=3156741 RepID=UPI0033A3271F